MTLVRATCGYPGSPRNGRVLHLLERYEEGMVITFECDPGYFLLGPMTRTCQSNNTWSGRMPICDQSIRNLGLTSASEALNNYPPQLAVDGNFRTCFFSNRRKPRWWRVELPKAAMDNQSIISVALTLPPINAELYFSIYVIEVETLTTNHGENDTFLGKNSTQTSYGHSVTTMSTSSKYHKCASFRGVFSSKTIFVQCSSNNGGLRGNYLQIEDDYPQLEYFGLCEVDVFVERGHYECGQVEVPAFGFVLDQQISVDGSRSVEYHCHDGYRLIGQSRRHCDQRTGQWIDKEPYCERITCPEPVSIMNGFHRMYGEDYYDQPVVGSRTVYECRPGFVFVDPNANDTRICDRYGQWSGSLDVPQCEPIDCGHPESLLVNSEEFFLSGAQFRLINGSTKFSALAELICSSQDVQRSNLTRSSLWFRCREDGLWTEIINQNETTISSSSSSRHRSSTSCVRQRHNGFLYFYGYGSSSTIKNFFRNKSFYIRETSVNILHLLAAVVIAAFLSILIIVILMFKRNIIEWPEAALSSSTVSAMKRRIKLTGESIAKFLLTIFNRLRNCLINSSSSSSPNVHSSQPESNSDNDGDHREHSEEKEEPRRASLTKSILTPPIFTITPSLSLDIESGRISRQQNANDNHAISSSQSSSSSSSPSSSSCSIVVDQETLNSNTNNNNNNSNNANNNNRNKNDLNQALATFYEEITNAAKQMFSEETDRKLIRAARIAAELDAIKNHTQKSANYHHHYPQQQPQQQQQYQWIYSTPPRFTHSSGCTSLPPSLHEYHQILPANTNSQQQQHPQVTQSQIYAKVDLIRKHRYRKEKDNIVSVYQVPKPRCPIISQQQQQQHQPQLSSDYHQLRKAISTPDAVFVDVNNDYGEYGTIRRIQQICSNTIQRPPNNKTMTTTTVTIHEPTNKFPLKTLL
nr:uncharacterized protein LOC124500480 [Dermatophagoides farinae]